ncbi:C-terminal binding protein [Citricoccus sp.]|uniref:C-terminal binding protein n=1 Tax=Citricoccus sp. TaxID=1978372 RepID=UPI0028BE335C|nr:C-terminal binding protein [Citricoccus sp.]
MRPRILVTDHPGADLEVERRVLAEAGADIVVAQSGGEEHLAELARDVDAIVTCFAQVTETVLRSATRCLTVARTGVGVDNIDVRTATELGMVVSNVPVYCTDEVADHALALMLALNRQLVPLSRSAAGGGWDRQAAPLPARLRGKVLGLVGMGEIGRALVPRARALGLEVMALRRHREVPAGVRTVDTLEALLAQSDIVSLHLPQTEQTLGLLGARELALMKPTAVLVNTARGGLVDTEALLAALERGALAGAGLDVTDPEPLPADHRLRSLDQVILTPHAAFASEGSLTELSQKAATNVADVLRGTVPADVVNPGVLDSVSLRLERSRS